MKGCFDPSVLLERETLDAGLLIQAIKAMFERRGMAVPIELLVGIRNEFAHDASGKALWQSFVSSIPNRWLPSWSGGGWPWNGC